MMQIEWRARWNEFFYKPESTVPISLFRIFYGLCILMTLLLLHGDWLQWFGVNGWVTLRTVQELEPGSRLNLFAILPSDDTWISGFFWFSFGCATLLTLGFWTRCTSALTFLCIASLQQRNLLIMHGGDTFLRVTGFFLIFAPAGSRFSLDAFFRNRGLPEASKSESRPPWAQRMIQGELSLLYVVSFLWKLKGDSWLNGRAVYYVFHLQDLVRFPVPNWLMLPIALRLATWMTMVLELALGTAIWWKPVRYPLLFLGLAFHLALEYSLNIPMFQWDVLTAYVLFISAADLTKWNEKAKHLLPQAFIWKSGIQMETQTQKVHIASET